MRHDIEFEIELSRVLFEYGLEINEVEIVEGDEISEYHYHIKTPSYWTDKYTEGVFKLCNSHMYNYCNEHDLWVCLLNANIIFE